MGPAAEPATPFLIQCLTNKSNLIRDEAAIGLGSMQRQPQLAVPALIDYLHFARTSPSKFELEDGIQTLARFGTEAKAAVPLLLTLLNDPEPAVRRQVTNCLPRIDPDAAAKAHVTRD